MGDELDKIFDSFDKNNIFKDKSFLQSKYTPEDIPHREKEITQIASILAPVLRGEKTSNLFLYGNTGTGKTLSIFKVKEALEKRMLKNIETGSELKIQYLNCKLKQVSDTEYRILAAIIRQLGGEVPATGLPTQSVYTKFIEIIEEKKQVVVLILDEVDQLVKKISNNFLYNLTRLNSELSHSQISLVGISNDLTFLENMDPRVKSSLSEEEIIFSPYNALQIQDILVKRVEGAFKKGVLEGGVVSKCAAYAARESGDARRALDLLRVSGELAERRGEKKVTIKHIDEAKSKIERDKILDLIGSHPKQFQIVLNSIISISEEKKGTPFFTGDVYHHYQKFCKQYRSEPLTQRRVGDIIQEFDMLGILNVRVISKGRGGRMREIKLGLSEPLLAKAKEIINSGLNYN
ncbi:cell division control protein Cdc6 [Candidatus Pacearchaeota archaeon CG10_big_fil_rev_8_21_14_0_10_32_42]|nr:MAG: cell division control protein Cdc6 [Candidatus Pacearchaeota archaeon CG10_big_fil_rev_8_21_14_0_10_32_42]